MKAGYGNLLRFAMAVVLLSGCSGSKVTTKASSQVGKYKVRKIVLLPFETMKTPQAVSSNAHTVPVPPGARRSETPIAFPPIRHQGVRTTHVVPPAAGEKITELMLDKLKRRSGLEVLSPGDAAAVTRELAGGTALLEMPAHKIAQGLRADAVLSGKVLVYQERVGGRLGADPPAAVGFEVKLIALDGNVLWEGNYYEKQRPMIEDIVGFFQRYGTFVTAEELADYGTTELADALPVGSASR